MTTETLSAICLLGYSHGVFFQIVFSGWSGGGLTLIEIPLHDGPASPRSITVLPGRFWNAVLTGRVTILPPMQASIATNNGHTRPYPFEVAGDRFWRRADIAGLRRRGLLMTASELVKLRKLKAARLVLRRRTGDAPDGDGMDA